MAAPGSVFKRCGCSEVVDGKRKQFGARCPKLRRKDGSWNPRHGRWYYQLSVPKPGGGRDRKPHGSYATEGEAQKALDAARDRVKRGVSVDDTRVGDYLARWLASKLDIARSTKRGYRIHIQTHWIPGLGHLNLADLRAAHVAEILAEVPGSDANRQRVRATLRSALGDALREGLVLVNVAGLVKLPSGKRPKALVWTDERVTRWRAADAALTAARDNGADPALIEVLETAALPPSPVMVWTPAQLGHFLDSAADDPLAPLFHLVGYRGLRRGEACGVRWVDVDLDAAHLTVAVQLVQDGWTVYESPPKSDAGERVVALDESTVAALRAQRRWQAERRLEFGPGWTDSGRVFTLQAGEQLHPAHVTSRFGTLAAAAKLPPITLHGLRHGAASVMLASGSPMKVVQETLGHSTIQLTADTYTSVFPQLAAAEAEAAAAVVPRKVATGTTVISLASHSTSTTGKKPRNRR